MSSQGMSIRDLRQDDAEWMPPVIEAFGYKPPKNLPTLVAEVLSCAQARCFVVECDGRPLGYALLVRRVSVCYENAPVWLEELAVSPEARGQGIGSILLEHCERYALEIGADQLVLTNRRSRESYQRSFYAKRGYKELDSAVFVKRLAEGAAGY